MQRYTVQQALEQEDVAGWLPSIYLFHDEETYFYIGISEQPFTRLEQHMGEGAYDPCPSPLGELILHNQPSSLQWLMDIYTLQELVPVPYAHLQAQGAVSREYRVLAEKIEHGFILHYKP